MSDSGRQLGECNHERLREYCDECAATPQPAPAPASGDIWLDVIEMMHQRRALGIQRYGTPLQAGNGRDALRDALEEALDLVAYLTQAIKERDTTN